MRVHILYHASQEPAYGTWLIEELAEHGYKLSPGTLYPILHGLEEENLLSSYEEVINGKVRKYYAITAAGRKVLKTASKEGRRVVPGNPSRMSDNSVPKRSSPEAEHWRRTKSQPSGRNS